MTRVSKSLPTGAIAKARRSEPRGSRRRGPSDHLGEGGFTGATRVAGRPVARRSALSGDRQRTRLWRRSRRIVRGSALRKERGPNAAEVGARTVPRGSVTRQSFSSSFVAHVAAKGPSRVAGSSGNGEERREGASGRGTAKNRSRGLARCGLGSRVRPEGRALLRGQRDRGPTLMDAMRSIGEARGATRHQRHAGRRRAEKKTLRASFGRLAEAGPAA